MGVPEEVKKFLTIPADLWIIFFAVAKLLCVAG
jgi:hypothetical protein